MNRRLSNRLKGLRSHPLTTTGLCLLLIGPAGLLLSSWPRLRPDAAADPSGQRELLQISDSMSMLQSFRVDAETKPPSLWKTRLGNETARLLWERLNGQIWWQGWPQDGAPVLMLPDWSTRPGDPIALTPESQAMSQRHGGMVLLFSDALNRQTFQQRFRAPAITAPAVEQFCFKQLRSTTAVHWTPDALASLSGAIQPLLASASHGCVSLNLSGRKLTWSGVVSSRPLRSASNRLKPPNPINIARLFPDAQDPGDGSSSPLLFLSGRTASTVFDSLLRRPPIRDGLEDNYGLNTPLIQELLDTPMTLSLLSSKSGSFQASVQLDLQVDGMTTSLTKALENISERLQQSDLQWRDQDLINPGGRSTTPARVWFLQDEDGQQRVLGGWSVLPADPALRNKPLLRFSIAAAPTNNRSSGRPVPDTGMLQATLRPSAMNELGLLHSGWPSPVRSSRKLDLVVRSLKGAAISLEDWRWMDGQLLLP